VRTLRLAGEGRRRALTLAEAVVLAAIIAFCVAGGLAIVTA
jgi:hypothetical protein